MEPTCFDRPVKSPPIELPEDPHLTFLSTVGEIYHEGVRMQHCVAQLTPRALSGESYLFHCEYENSEATIEVHETGAVIQAGGPRNRKNPARNYGIDVLKAWGRQSDEELRSHSCGLADRCSNRTNSLPPGKFVRHDFELGSFPSLPSVHLRCTDQQ